MEVNISLNKDTITLGQAVTVTYSASGFMDTQLTIPNFPNPIDLGGGEQSGTIKVLPVTDGEFTVTLTGFGDANIGSDSTCAKSATATCVVN